MATAARLPSTLATARASNSDTPAIRLTTPAPIRRRARTSHSARTTQAAKATSSSTSQTLPAQPTQ